jgi:hypothetical protein
LWCRSRLEIHFIQTPLDGLELACLGGQSLLLLGESLLLSRQRVPLLLDLVQQYRREFFVTHALDATVLGSNDELRIDLRNLFGDQPILDRAPEAVFQLPVLL